MRRIRKFLVGSASTAVLLAWSPAQAAPITFDFDGPGGNAAVTGVVGFDYAPGNILAVNSTPLVPGANFTSYYQATLQALQTTGGNVAPPAGREVTIVAQVNEQVASFVAGVANFNVLGGSYSVYAGPANANNLAGTGFNDGTLILSGSLTGGGINNFTFTPNTVQFDQFNTNDYPGVLALFGIGGFLTNATVGFSDPNFINLLGQAFASSSFNGNTQSFFNTVDPSMSFANAGYVPAPSRGMVNGVSGPDSQFQIDANQAFEFRTLPPPPPPPGIPEPASLATFAVVLGVGAAGVARKRRQQATEATA